MKRNWNVDAAEPEEVAELFNDIESIGRCLGGGFVIGAIRREVEGGGYVTIGWDVRYESFVPTVDAAPPVED